MRDENRGELTQDLKAKAHIPIAEILFRVTTKRWRQKAYMPRVWDTFGAPDMNNWSIHLIRPSVLCFLRKSISVFYLNWQNRMFRSRNWINLVLAKSVAAQQCGNRKQYNRFQFSCFFSFLLLIWFQKIISSAEATSFYFFMAFGFKLQESLSRKLRTREKFVSVLTALILEYFWILVG